MAGQQANQVRATRMIPNKVLWLWLACELWQHWLMFGYLLCSVIPPPLQRIQKELLPKCKSLSSFRSGLKSNASRASQVDQNVYPSPLKSNASRASQVDQHVYPSPLKSNASRTSQVDQNVYPSPLSEVDYSNLMSL
jgi:hypothetical protein